MKRKCREERDRGTYTLLGIPWKVDIREEIFQGDRLLAELFGLHSASKNQRNAKTGPFFCQRERARE